MKKIIAFIILMSVSSPNAFSIEGLQEVPVAVSAIENVEFVNVLPARRAWSDDDLQGESLTSNFSNWMTCYSGQNLGNSYSESCRCSATGEPVTGSAINLGMRSCLPDYYDRSLVFSDKLQLNQQIERDDLICACFDSKQSIEYILSGGQASSKERAEARRQLETNLRENSERSRLQTIFGDNFGAAVTVMNFARNGEAEDLAGIYINKGTRIRDEDVRSLQRIVENEGNLTDDQCIPPREFIFESQFPREAVFYTDLNRPYREQDWNYGTLAQRLKAISTDPVKNYAEIDSLRARMSFLIKNPAFKALFMSNDQGSLENKQALHAILKRDFPRPECNPDILDVCITRGANFSRMMSNYQNKIAGFLAQSSVNDDIETGVKRARELAASLKGPTSEGAMSSPAQGSYRDWSSFCQLRKNAPNAEAVNPIVLRLEAENRTDYANLSQNSRFQHINRHYCNTPRTNAQGGEIANFRTYREQSCRDIDRRKCLANYLRDYPGTKRTAPAGEIDANTVAELTFDDQIGGFLENAEIFDQVERGSTARIAQISQDPSARSQSFRSLAEVDRSGMSNSNVSRVPASVLQPARVASSNPQSQTQSQQAQLQAGTVFNSNPTPEVQIPLAASQAATQAPRSQATEESQTRVNDLSAELEGLRAQIAQRRDNAENPELASLRRQYSMVEESLRKAQERLAENERLDAERRAASADNDEDDREDTPRRARRSARAVSGSVASNSVSAASVTPQTVQAASSALAPVSAVSSGGGSASLSGGSARQSARNTSTSQNRTAGSANGSADIAAITVASNSVAEYEQVRAEAAVNQISESASPEVLSQIERGDASFLEQYRKRIEAFPGKYVLLDLGDLEFVVAKNGEQLSLMSKDGRFIASDARPEPVRERTESEREHTLRALQNNLSQ